MTDSARPALALRPGLRFRWLLCRPVKVKSLVCLNQCARKRPSYLCPVIMETSLASRTQNPTSQSHPPPLSLWFLHPFDVPRYAHGTGRTWDLAIVRPTGVAECTYTRAKRAKLRRIHVMSMSLHRALRRYIFYASNFHIQYV